jgi:hypothetical protein
MINGSNEYIVIFIILVFLNILAGWLVLKLKNKFKITFNGKKINSSERDDYIIVNKIIKEVNIIRYLILFIVSITFFYIFFISPY